MARTGIRLRLSLNSGDTLPKQPMFSSPTTTCPKCGSVNCRDSRWKNHAEKNANPALHPYRCEDCSHRFLAPRLSDKGLKILLAAAGAVTTALVVTAVVVLVPDDTEEWVDSAPVAAVEHGPQAVTADVLAAAEAGDADAQYRLGKNLMLDAALDPRKALDAMKWLSRAAESGNTSAMIHLARMYRNGIGALQNYDNAARWITRAAEKGDPEGMLELGRLYRDGVGIEQDVTMAYVWFNRAAALLNLDAARERDGISRRMNEAQLQRAQHLSASTAVAEADPPQTGTTPVR